MLLCRILDSRENCCFQFDSCSTVERYNRHFHELSQLVYISKFTLQCMVAEPWCDTMVDKLLLQPTT